MNKESLENKDDYQTNILAKKRTDLAIERTRLASDRTLMSWMRTSLSLISFGFTIYKFFQYLRDSGSVSGDWRPTGPRNLGLTLIIIGVFLLGVAVVENILFSLRLNKLEQRKFYLSSSIVTAVLLTILGLLAILNLIYKVGPF